MLTAFLKMWILIVQNSTSLPLYQKMVINIPYQQAKRKGMKRKSTNGKGCTSFREVNTKMYFDSSITWSGIAAVLLRENNTVLSKLFEIITSEGDTCTQI